MIEFLNPNLDEIGRLSVINLAPLELLDGSTAPAAAVGARFMLSEYGIYMNDHQPLRFSQTFGYDSSKMVEDLGTDVLPVHHQWDNGMYVARILEAEISTGRQLPIHQDEVALAVFTAYIHDIGESTHPKVTEAVGESVGDIPYGQKTAHNRAVEARVRNFMYKELFSDVKPQLLTRVERLIAHQEDSPLHDLLEAAHSVQAYSTGAHAGLVANMLRSVPTGTAEEHVRSSEEIAAMTDLNKQVFHNMAPVMTELAERYVFVAKIATLYGLVA